VTLLYAIGVGALANVAVAIVGRLLRLAIVRLALLGLAAHASLLLNRFLGVAFSGRTPGDGSIDAFQFTPLALALLIGGLVLGVAIGLIFRGFGPRLPSWRPPALLVKAAGIAYVVGTIVALAWPAPFLAQLFGDADLVTAVLSLPVILAGPLVGGAYAARAGVDYRSIALLGAYMSFPIIITLVAGTVSGVGALGDPRFESVAGQLRGTIVLSWFLVVLRLAGWPLGAAFAQGFLSPATPARTEPAP
jgi:hypothetical protein